LGNNARFVASRLSVSLSDKLKRVLLTTLSNAFNEAFCLWLFPNRYRHFDPIGTAFIQSEAGAGQPFAFSEQ
jgi:hypothetical protein